MDDDHVNKKPRRQLTIHTKVQILLEVEKKELSKAAIARKYHIPFSSLSTIVTSRERIFDKYYSSLTSNCRIYKAKYEQVEFKLFEFVTDCHRKSMKLNGPILQQEAQKVAKEMGFTEFKCSNGWLSNFKRRFRHFASLKSLPKETDEEKQLIEKGCLEDVQKWIDKHKLNINKSKQEDKAIAGPSIEDFPDKNSFEEFPSKILDDNSSVETSDEEYPIKVEHLHDSIGVQKVLVKNPDENLYDSSQVRDLSPHKTSNENSPDKYTVENSPDKKITIDNLPDKDTIENLPNIKNIVEDLPVKTMSVEKKCGNVPLLPWQVINSNGEALFSWPKYLEHLKARAAPTKLFPDGGFPYQRNGFRPGMRLEGIDPRMPSQFCALSVSDVKGYRIKLHFEGWPDTNDFWVNADSRDIFAVGFCEKSGRSLVPPRGYPKTTFSWTPYLKLLKASAAPRQLFLHRPTTKNAVGPSGFRVGMKLEAVDKQNQELICVATVADILDGRLLVHFDSWDHTYDYWVEPTSPYIHPLGWCEQNKRTLTPPNGYTEFDWDNYLKETKSSAVPSRAFKPKSIAAFKKGMKLECVDPRFPDLIRVSTVNDCRRHRIQISFDGWPLETAVWVDCDSSEIHPMGWCNKTGHLLTPPPGPNQEHYCITPGCRALLKNSQLILPHSCNSCPLSTVNLANVNKVKKIPVKETIAVKPPVESSEGEDFKGDSDDEDYIDEKPEPPPKKKKLDCSLKSLRLDVHESIFSPGYVPSPAELPLNWSKHAHLLNIENKKPLNNKVVRTWSPHQVQNFVSSLPGCEEKSKAFIDEKIDGESLLLLTQSDLISMLGFKVGPAIKLYSSITLLKNKKQEV